MALMQMIPLNFFVFKASVKFLKILVNSKLQRNLLSVIFNVVRRYLLKFNSKKTKALPSTLIIGLF